MDRSQGIHSHGASAVLPSPLGASMEADLSFHVEDRPEADRIKHMILQKERELRDINAYRVQGLEDVIKERERQLGEEKKRFEVLKGDFEYNLKLLEDRDAELDKYETSFVELREVLKRKETEISEANNVIARLRSSLKNEQSRSEDTHKSSEQKNATLKREIEVMKSSYQDQLKSRDAEKEAVVKDLRNQLERVREQHEHERRELAQEFDLAINQLQEGNQQQVELLEKQLAEGEEKYASAMKELRMKNGEYETLRDQFDDIKSSFEQLSQKLKSQSWEVEDDRRSYESRISSLESELRHCKDERKKFGSDQEKRTKELTRSLVELKDKYEAEVQKLTSDWRRLLDERNAEYKQLDSESSQKIAQLQGEARAAHDREESMQKNLAELEAKYQQSLENRNHEAAQKDLESRSQFAAAVEEAKALQEKNKELEIEHVRKSEKLSQAEAELENLKVHVLQLRSDSANYAEKERLLRLELEEEKCRLEKEVDSGVAAAMNRNKDLVRTLNVRKEELEHDLDQKQTQIKHLEEKLQALERRNLVAGGADRDNFMEKGLYSDLRRSSHVQDGTTSQPSASGPESVLRERIVELEDQNTRIRNVVKEMRDEMEQLERQRNPSDTASSATASELMACRRENEDLRSRIEELRRASSSTVVETLNEKNLELLSSLEEKEVRLREVEDSKRVLEAENRQLRRKLKLAVEDINKLAEERERLLEASNILRSEVGRAKSHSVAAKKQSDSHAARNAGEYDHRMKDLEQAMSSLLTQNQQLQQQLSSSRLAQVERDSGRHGHGAGNAHRSKLEAIRDQIAPITAKTMPPPQPKTVRETTRVREQIKTKRSALRQSLT